jgi:drug/metabolite transporter (DMT)-like permease
MTEDRKPGRATIVVTVVVLCLIWGSTWIVIKEGLRDLPAISGAAYRFTLAALILVAVGHWLHKLEGGAKPPMRLVIAMGAFNFAISYGIVYWAETVIPSGLASVLWGVFPMMMAVAGHMFLPGEQLDRRSFAGFLVGLVGVVVLFATDLRDIGPDAIGFGALLLLSPISATIGQTIIKRQGARFSATLLNRNGMIVGAIALWIVALLTEDPFSVQWTRNAILSVVYLGALGTVVTFGAYYWLLRWVPSNKLALIAYVTPAIALWVGWMVGDEALHLSTLLGTLLVLSGIALVVRRNKRP